MMDYRVFDVMPWVKRIVWLYLGAMRITAAAFCAWKGSANLQTARSGLCCKQPEVDAQFARDRIVQVCMWRLGIAEV